MKNDEFQLLQLTIGGEAEGWSSIGFNLMELSNGESICRIGSVRFLFDHESEQKGIWLASTNEVSGQIDSLEFGESKINISPDEDALIPSIHPNGITRIDHLVVTTPDCDRTTAALEKDGLQARRVRIFGNSGSEMRQTFFWLGDVILELVGPETPEGEGPASFWGLAFISESIEETVTFLGDTCTPLKPAVQSGRQITTIKTRDLGIHSSLAVMSPHVDTV